MTPGGSQAGPFPRFHALIRKNRPSVSKCLRAWARAREGELNRGKKEELCVGYRMKMKIV